MTIKEVLQDVYNFDRAVAGQKRAWERQSTQGRDTKTRLEYHRQRCEQIAERYGIKLEWPGLYPSFRVKGDWYYDFTDALNAVLQVARLWRTREEK